MFLVHRVQCSYCDGVIAIALELEDVRCVNALTHVSMLEICVWVHIVPCAWS